MTKNSNLISHSRRRGVVLLLCGLLLGVLFLLAEETVASCRMACIHRYQAYFEDCLVAFASTPSTVEECWEIVQGFIDRCYLGCGENG
jgi:hypothetical protein